MVPQIISNRKMIKRPEKRQTNQLRKCIARIAITLFNIVKKVKRILDVNNHKPNLIYHICEPCYLDNMLTLFFQIINITSSSVVKLIAIYQESCNIYQF